MKILVWSSEYRKPVEDRLRALDGVDVVSAHDVQQFGRELPGTDAIVAMTELRQPAAIELLEARGRDVKWIQLLLRGDDGVRIGSVRTHIRITTVGDVYSAGVAEHAMALMLALARRLHTSMAYQSRNIWNADYSSDIVSLEGATLAIIGFGRIGQEIAHRARPFGMRIVGVRRSLKPDPLADEIRSIHDLHDVVAEADVVLLALPLTPVTKAIFGRLEFAATKDGALLINVGRGALFDMQALREVLALRRLSGVALDVTEPEPLSESDPLWSHPDLVITPHVAGRGHEPSIRRMVEVVASNVENFRAGLPLLNEVTIV